MKNKKSRKLDIRKIKISDLQLQQVNGGAHGSCVPTCQPIKSLSVCNPTAPGRPGENGER